MITLKYSNAFYSIAKKRNDVKNVLIDFGIINQLLSNKNLKMLLEMPSFSTDKKLEILRKIPLESYLSLDLIKFLFVKNHFSIFSEILTKLKCIDERKNKIIILKVYSKETTTEKFKIDLIETFSSRIDATFKIKEFISENILGGFKVKFEDKVIDFTFKNRLELIESYLLKGENNEN